MQIAIAVIRIQMITNLGSLNIGTTVFCRNRATTVSAGRTVAPGPAGPSAVMPEPTIPTPP
ncbi:MAG: hypothetical protein BLM47_04855 [Candidatus Reconcilbacillus cellulovorans]|uniref:Uncharacterized protein n=1 Tax=Candidatus Reconcilbacillus cellulovorans TaxID=1906605 RepID=A0A2A6E200_9BACL|nr:MAG: hypothetical protein BLM47_04855 [Candidatus Reconcilbacillus cellulovorans]